MKHKHKIGDEVAVQRWNKLQIAKIIRLGEENGMPVYDTDDGHWCYEDQIIARREAEVPQAAGITLTKEQAEKIADYLRGYYNALDNILYPNYGHKDLQDKLFELDALALVIERQVE